MISNEPRLRTRNVIGLACGCTLMGTMALAQPTTIDDLIMYAVDNTSHELIRYGFGPNSAEVVDMIHLSDGTVLTDVESLAYIPGRLFFYSVSNASGGGGCGGSSSTLVKIDMFTGEASPAPFTSGYKNIEGMVALEYFEDDGNGGHGNDCDGFDEDNRGNSSGVNSNGQGQGAHSGCWILMGVTWETQGMHDRYRLISIDPDTGQGSLVMSLARRYEGLAAALDGSLYGSSGSSLYRIDMVAETETLVGAHTYQGICGLEFAYGTSGTTIEVPDVDPIFWQDGILFGFSNIDNTLVFIDRASGNALARSSSVGSAGLQGLVFLTDTGDPQNTMAAVAID